MTTKNKILAYILVFALFIVAALLYFEASSKGFPDGHLTELDIAERPLFHISTVLCILTGFFLWYLARLKKAVKAKKLFHRTLIFVLLMVLAFIFFDWYLMETFDDGVGG